MKRKYQYITGFTQEDFFRDVRRGMRDAAAELNVDVEFTGTLDADPEALSRMIRQAVDDGMDGLAVNILHPTGFHEALEYCRQRNVPVVTFNIDGETELRLATVSQNFVQAGTALGAFMADRIPEGAHVLFTLHDAGISALDTRMASMAHALQDRKLQTSSLVTGNTPELARDAILQELDRHPDISVILGTGQSDTHGAALAALEQPDRALTIAGFDVCPEILQLICDGVIIGTVEQQPYVQGYFPLVLLQKYHTEHIVPFDIDAGNSICTRDRAQLLLSLGAF